MSARDSACRRGLRGPEPPEGDAPVRVVEDDAEHAQEARADVARRVGVGERALTRGGELDLGRLEARAGRLEPREPPTPVEWLSRVSRPASSPCRQPFNLNIGISPVGPATNGDAIISSVIGNYEYGC